MYTTVGYIITSFFCELCVFPSTNKALLVVKFFRIKYISVCLLNLKAGAGLDLKPGIDYSFHAAGEPFEAFFNYSKIGNA